MRMTTAVSCQFYNALHDWIMLLFNEILFSALLSFRLLFLVFGTFVSKCYEDQYLWLTKCLVNTRNTLTFPLLRKERFYEREREWERGEKANLKSFECGLQQVFIATTIDQMWNTDFCRQISAFILNFQWIWITCRHSVNDFEEKKRFDLHKTHRHATAVECFFELFIWTFSSSYFWLNDLCTYALAHTHTHTHLHQNHKVQTISGSAGQWVFSVLSLSHSLPTFN